MWEVEYTDEFGGWWDQLNEAEQIDVTASVNLLESYGPQLGFPYSSGIQGSKHSHIREVTYTACWPALPCIVCI